MLRSVATSSRGPGSWIDRRIRSSSGPRHRTCRTDRGRVGLIGDALITKGALMAFASRPYAERGDRHAPREAPVVHAKADDARATFECLGARPFSVKLEEVFGGSVAHRPPATSVVDNEAEVTTA